MGSGCMVAKTHANCLFHRTREPWSGKSTIRGQVSGRFHPVLFFANRFLHSNQLVDSRLLPKDKAGLLRHQAGNAAGIGRHPPHRVKE